jgi:hypothetical protein
MQDLMLSRQNVFAFITSYCDIEQPYRWVLSFSSNKLQGTYSPEDGCNMYVRNVRIHRQDCTVSKPYPSISSLVLTFLVSSGYLLLPFFVTEVC